MCSVIVTGIKIKIKIKMNTVAVVTVIRVKKGPDWYHWGLSSSEKDRRMAIRTKVV